MILRVLTIASIILCAITVFGADIGTVIDQAMTGKQRHVLSGVGDSASADSARRLGSTVRRPPRASAMAIPGPIIPVPITAPVRNVVFDLTAIILRKLDCSKHVAYNMFSLPRFGNTERMLLLSNEPTAAEGR